MDKFTFSCHQNDLHPDLQKAFFESEMLRGATKIMRKKSWLFVILRFWGLIVLSFLGYKHYDSMGLLGYKTLLVDQNSVKNLLGGKKYKRMLDIGAGSGTVTEAFESFVETIDCTEGSPSFTKILEKKGYRVVTKIPANNYDVVTVFNVFDICTMPDFLMKEALRAMKDDGLMIISLPLPICVQSWDHKKIRKTNNLSQSSTLGFEKGASEFYTNFLMRNGLRVEKFTRLPYIVSLPESINTKIYDNGLFVCKKLH